VSLRARGDLAELAQKCFCHAEIGGLKALGESTVNRRKSLSRVLPSILPHSKPGKTHGGPQFPKEGTLFPGHLKRFVETVISRGNRLIVRCLEQYLTLDAKEFGHTPAQPVAIVLIKTSVNHRQSLGTAADPGKTFRKISEETREMHGKLRAMGYVVRCIQQPQTTALLATLDKKRSL
jgi:hypothetical protein